MKNTQSVRTNWSWLRSWQPVQGLLAGLSLGMLVLGSLAPVQAEQVSAPAAKLAGLTDGVYLYGQSPTPDRIGQAYFVFEVRQGKVLGALYMPQSSFDCTYGEFQANQLALTVVDSYEQTRHPYAIALESRNPVASTGNPVAKLDLQGFHPIAQVSDNDRRILNVCKQNYQQQVWK